MNPPESYTNLLRQTVEELSDTSKMQGLFHQHRHGDPLPSLFVFASVRFLSFYVDVLKTALNPDANRFVLAAGILCVCAYCAYKGVFTTTRCALIGAAVISIFVIIFLIANISDVELNNLYRSNSIATFAGGAFSLLPVCILPVIFSALIAVAKTSKTMLNSSGESGHPCLVPDFRGNAFNFSPLRIMFAVGLS